MGHRARTARVTMLGGIVLDQAAVEEEVVMALHGVAPRTTRRGMQTS